MKLNSHSHRTAEPAAKQDKQESQRRHANENPKLYKTYVNQNLKRCKHSYVCLFESISIMEVWVNPNNVM